MNYQATKINTAAVIAPAMCLLRFHILIDLNLIVANYRIINIGPLQLNVQQYLNDLRHKYTLK